MCRVFLCGRLGNLAAHRFRFQYGSVHGFSIFIYRRVSL